MTRNRNRLIAGIALAAGAASIPVQIAGGVNYPTIPPGLIILLVAAAGMLFVRPWWGVLVGLLGTVFLIFGAVVAPNFRDQLSHPGDTLAFVGSWIQAAAMLVALIASVAAVFSDRRTSGDVRVSASSGGRPPHG